MSYVYSVYHEYVAVIRFLRSLKKMPKQNKTLNMDGKTNSKNG